MADLILVSKVNFDKSDDFKKAEKHAKELKKITKADTPILYGGSIVSPVGDEEQARSLVNGKKVLVIDDGPTLTHGGIPYGAGYVLAQKLGAQEIIDPRAHAKGSLKDDFKKFSHLKNVLPAMGYDKEQVRDLEDIIRATPCDAVVIGTPSDMTHVVDLDKIPRVVAKYELEIYPPDAKQFTEILNSVIERNKDK